MDQLVPPPQLKRLCRAIADLEEHFMPEWSLRKYSYYENYLEDWDMFQMRNGSGDEFFILFAPEGIFIKGLAHELFVASPELIRKQVPARFQKYTNEPSIGFEDTSFVIWSEDDHWAKAKVTSQDDGSSELLAILDGTPETYQKWAAGYYEREIPLTLVQETYSNS